MQGRKLKLARSVQAVARRGGIDLFLTKPDPFRWSHTAEAYYPVLPHPRWKPGQKVYERLTNYLETFGSSYIELIEEAERHRDLFLSIPYLPTEGHLPCWHNSFFTAFDAVALISLLAMKRPKRYVEIGSGMSTRFANYGRRQLGLDTTITSVDPHPRFDIDRYCDEVVRAPLEDCDLDLFLNLEPGDFLFFDGSHRIFTNSDVHVFFFEILPDLRPGVIVQIHDVFLPFDYPQRWGMRFYNEQYMLASFLLSNNRATKTIAPIAYMTKVEPYASLFREMMRPEGDVTLPHAFSNNPEMSGASFWLEAA